MNDTECGKRSVLKGARCVWKGARSLDFAYSYYASIKIFHIFLLIQCLHHNIAKQITSFDRNSIGTKTYS